MNDARSWISDPSEVLGHANTTPFCTETFLPLSILTWASKLTGLSCCFCRCLKRLQSTKRLTKADMIETFHLCLSGYCNHEAFRR
jgi:hypothetical protein